MVRPLLGGLGRRPPQGVGTRTGRARPVLCGRAVGILHAGLGYGLVSRARCEDAQGRALVVPARDKIPLTDKLDPTDTGVMRLQFRQIR